MKTQIEKPKAPLAQHRAKANATSKGPGAVAFAKSHLETAYLDSLQHAANDSPQLAQLAQLKAMAENHSNNTGLPDGLKTGVENLSGFAMDDVRVHYNSAKPGQLRAHAFAQGTDIHVAPGQEKHLPHEAWHVVQQKQGRVAPTLQMKEGIPVNDDTTLEKEADVMGDKALTMREMALGNPKTLQMKAEVKITENGLELGREHDLKRYLDLSYTTAEKGNSESEMKKQNTYRHMDSQATRRDAMANMMRYYLEDHPVVEGATELCADLQPRIDEWEMDVEGKGGQFLGNAPRNTAISNEYDSLVLELKILGREVTENAIIHDLAMNIRNTAFKVLGDSNENIEIVLKNAYTEEDTTEEDFKSLLPIFQIGIDKSIDLTYQKLANSKTLHIDNLAEKCRETSGILKGALSDNIFEVMKIFYQTAMGAHAAVAEVAEQWNPAMDRSEEQTGEDDY